ncbi:MAG: adenylate kinase [Clostridiales Family XIII bacterium]|jgi:adenylate kinase|nr:adenylate kinase [Clostridiales Family XIII bacterium]
MKKKFILLGAPGSGKGTLAERATAKYGILQISTGDIFRHNVADGTELGKKAKEYMQRGDLVPDGLVLDLVTDRLSQDDAQKGYMLDGFPRTIVQAEALNKTLEKSGTKIDAVVYLNVPRDELVKRLSGRRTCSVCGRSYNVGNPEFAPAVDGVCDVDGGELVQRHDDDKKVAEGRIDVYNEQTHPLVKYYQAAGILTELNGMDGAVRNFELFSKLIEA